MKILLADNDVVARMFLTTALLGLGHDVLVARDGEEAWATLLRQPVPVVVSDWAMSKLDGLELCRRIRSRPGKDYVYFILLTVRSGKDNYRQAMEAGIDDFLIKSRDLDELPVRLKVAERILSFIHQVRDLKQLLPICSYCKKIRDDKDYWHQIESYIHEHTGSDFSHSICPECYEKVIKPQLQAARESEDDASI